MLILAIDPGNIQSAFILWNGKNIIDKGILINEELINKLPFNSDHLAIEMIASYGMPVGKTVFDTCVWTGRFIQMYFCVKFRRGKIEDHVSLIYRHDIKMYFCHSIKGVKDANIIQVLVDKFGDINMHGKYAKGTKKNPGFFFEFAEDMWQAMAVAVYHYDNFIQTL